MDSFYVSANEELFPKKLKSVKPIIQGLWAKGELGICESEKIVAIVGSRRMSQYGKRVLGEIVPRFVEMGYTTISGFMYGVDIEMHRLTIENGGRTIGVFGWGIDAEVPKDNENLYHKVVESNGLFLSELEPKKLGELWTFPRRNRIVVGLADLVVVVEAGIKSGSLNSAEWARKMGKEVYAVPGSIFSDVSSGCNYLIAKGFAKSMSLDFFKQENYSKKGAKNQAKVIFTKDESKIIDHLKIGGPKSLNELSRELNFSVAIVSSELTSLLIKGVVNEERGVWGLT